MERFEREALEECFLLESPDAALTNDVRGCDVILEPEVVYKFLIFKKLKYSGTSLCGSSYMNCEDGRASGGEVEV